MKKKPACGSNLNGKLCVRRLILKVRNVSLQSEMHLSSEDPTGNSTINTPMMKTGSRHSKGLQLLHTLCFARVHQRNLRPAFLKILIAFTQWIPIQDHMDQLKGHYIPPCYMKKASI